jgi:methylthioribose-1-phosphate isomerase
MARPPEQNPAFDVTSTCVITGVVTEHGVLRAPSGPAIAEPVR